MWPIIPPCAENAHCPYVFPTISLRLACILGLSRGRPGVGLSAIQRRPIDGSGEERTEMPTSDRPKKQDENKGESDVAANKMRVKITGINPAEFGVTQADLTKNAPDDIISQKKSPEGDITPGPLVFIEFLGLNYQSKITGTQITFPLKADICYDYKTNAVGKICVRRDILKPEEEGVCEVTGDKTIYSSSAPIQIANLKESARAKNKIGFTFEIINAGEGSIYKKETTCDKTERQNENRVFVKVETNLAGLSCVGLDSVGSGVVEGFTTLYAGSKIISCTQETPVNDFEQVIKVSAEYDYETSIISQITVKSSEIV